MTGVVHDRPDETSARLATATGLVAFASDAAFAVFAVAGEPWGSLNDTGIAATGVLGALLSWRLRRRIGTASASTALVGGAVAAIGSSLVVSRRSGWLLAGYVSSVGFALIAPSVYLAARADAADGSTSRAVANIGLAAAATMSVGIIGVVPVAMGIDDPADAPPWTWLTFVGSAGSLLLYPIWAVAAARQWRTR